MTIILKTYHKVNIIHANLLHIIIKVCITQIYTYRVYTDTHYIKVQQNISYYKKIALVNNIANIQFVVYISF